MDQRCKVRIYAKIDDFFEKLMGKLELTIPPFELRRLIKIENIGDSVKVTGLTESGNIYDLFKSVNIVERNLDYYKIHLEFHGHYNE